MTNRRSFLKHTLTMATAGSMGAMNTLLADGHDPSLNDTIHDAGMQLSEAYFFGMEEQRIAFAKQMNVLAAVTGVQRNAEAKPWESRAIIANKEAWEKVGLKWNVVEGPPALGDWRAWTTGWRRAVAVAAHVTRTGRVAQAPVGGGDMATTSGCQRRTRGARE